MKRWMLTSQVTLMPSLQEQAVLWMLSNQAAKVLTNRSVPSPPYSPSVSHELGNCSCEKVTASNSMNLIHDISPIDRIVYTSLHYTVTMSAMAVENKSMLLSSAQQRGLCWNVFNLTCNRDTFHGISDSLQQINSKQSRPPATQTWDVFLSIQRRTLNKWLSSQTDSRWEDEYSCLNIN